MTHTIYTTAKDLYKIITETTTTKLIRLCNTMYNIGLRHKWDWERERESEIYFQHICQICHITLNLLKYNNMCYFQKMVFFN